MFSRSSVVGRYILSLHPVLEIKFHKVKVLSRLDFNQGFIFPDSKKFNLNPSDDSNCIYLFPSHLADNVA